MASDREIVLGVGGGIAAYKSCDLLRRLQDHGFAVTVVPTPSSLNFVGAATWEALSGRPVTSSVWERVDEVRHVLLGKNANAIIIALQLQISSPESQWEELMIYLQTLS